MCTRVFPRTWAREWQALGFPTAVTGRVRLPLPSGHCDLPILQKLEHRRAYLWRGRDKPEAATRALGEEGLEPSPFGSRVATDALPLSYPPEAKPIAFRSRQA